MRVKDKSTEGSFTNVTETVGIVGVKSPHNEEPFAIMKLAYLKQMVEILEYFDEDKVYLWRLTSSSHDGTGLVATHNEDPDAGIAVAGMTEAFPDQ